MSIPFLPRVRCGCSYSYFRFHHAAFLAFVLSVSEIAALRPDQIRRIHLRYGGWGNETSSFPSVYAKAPFCVPASVRDTLVKRITSVVGLGAHMPSLDGKVSFQSRITSSLNEIDFPQCSLTGEVVGTIWGNKECFVDWLLALSLHCVILRDGDSNQVLSNSDQYQLSRITFGHPLFHPDAPQSLQIIACMFAKVLILRSRALVVSS